MKLLIVSNMYPSKEFPSYGVFVKNFCDELNDMNIQFDKSVMKKGKNVIEKIIRYIFFYLNTFFLVLFSKHDIIYVHYASYSSIPVLLANIFKKKNIYVNVHGSDVVPENKRQEFMNKFTKKILKKSKKIIVPSEYFKEYVISKYKLPNEKIFVFPSAGINSQIFYPRKQKDVEKLKQDLNINNDLLTFGIVGRITKDKGWDDFVKAVKLVKNQNVNANYIIVGDGNQKDKLLELIKNEELNENIKLVNLLPQEKLAEFYSTIDYLVFPTKRKGESLGLVALEAMACGTPVISSDFAAPHYYIHDKENGYKYDVGNYEELSNIMIKLIKNKNVDNDIKKNALETAKMYYPENILNILKNILEIN